MVSVALEPTACSSARLELPPEVVSGSVLIASAQFVVRVVSTLRGFDLGLGRRDADGGRTTPCTLSPCLEWIQ